MLNSETEAFKLDTPEQVIPQTLPRELGLGSRLGPHALSFCMTQCICLAVLVHAFLRRRGNTASELLTGHYALLCACILNSYANAHLSTTLKCLASGK